MAKFAGFSEAGYIALHCMKLIAGGGGAPMSAKEMAAALKVSEAHLAKVVRWLSKAGLLNTVRGPRGGAVLARPADEISFLDVVEAIDGPIKQSGCVFGHKSCVYKECIFGDFLTHINGEAVKWLSSKKLSD